MYVNMLGYSLDDFVTNSSGHSAWAPGRTDWANFRLLGDVFFLAVFEKYISSTNFWVTFLPGKSYKFVLTKKTGWVTFRAIF
jgi:hypothetical protein